MSTSPSEAGCIAPLQVFKRGWWLDNFKGTFEKVWRKLEYTTPKCASDMIFFLAEGNQERKRRASSLSFSVESGDKYSLLEWDLRETHTHLTYSVLPYRHLPVSHSWEPKTLSFISPQVNGSLLKMLYKPLLCATFHWVFLINNFFSLLICVLL